MQKRIFTAIDISEQARRQAADYIENLRREFSGLRVSWEKPEKIHLTLKFLGDCDERQIKNLETAVSNAAKIFAETEEDKNIKIRILDTGVFPSARNARILWLGLQDEKQSLSKINQILETECEKIGFEKEKRNFKPHLTIARLREPQKSGNLAEKHFENEFEPVEFEISEIVIYESKLLPTGSIYRKLKGFRFDE
jgi:RNA 2',3'-cyclic 3'-phosphodiesterase